MRKKLLALLLVSSAALAQQTVSPVGQPTPDAVNVQVDPATPLKVDVGGATVTGTFNSTCKANAAAPTFVEGSTANQLSCDLTGNLRTAGGGGGGSSSDVAIHDNGTPSQHLGINGSGQAAIQNPPNLDATLSTRATETTVQAVRDRLPAALDADGGLKAHIQNTVTTTTTIGTDAVGLAKDATLTGGGAKAILRGAAKGTTSAADATTTASGANHQGVDVVLYDTSGSALDPRTRTWSLSSGTDSVNVGNFPTLYDVSDRTARLLGHVTVDNASLAVTGTFWQSTQPVSIASMPSTPVTGTFWQATQPVSGTFWQATQPVSGTFWQTTQPVSGTFWQSTQPVSLAAAVDVSDRAGRLVGKVRQTDGALDITLLNSAPVSDTGQVALPVRVVSQLGAGSGGGGSTATTMYSGTLVVNPASSAVSLPANTSKTVCVRNLRKDYAADGMDHNVYIGSDATLSQYNAGGWVEPGEEDCEAIASSGTVYVFSPGGSQIAYRGVN